MGYEKKKYVIGNTIEHEIGWKGRIPNNYRRARRALTPEQMRKQNLRVKEKRLRRMLAANFKRRDVFVTLKYSSYMKLQSVNDVKKHMRSFLDKMRYEYRKRGYELKFIYRPEVGSINGNVHIHIIMSKPGNVRLQEIQNMIADAWKKYGDVHTELLQESDTYEKLANYMCKQPEGDELEELENRYSKEEIKYLMKLSSSRNLRDPQPEITPSSESEIDKFIRDDYQPTPGYYVDRDSIYCGENSFTGMRYLSYREIKIGYRKNKMEQLGLRQREVVDAITRVDE